MKDEKCKNKIYDIGICMLKSGLRLSEIRNQNSEYSCLSLKNNNQLNKQPHCLSCQKAIITVKHNQITEKKLSFNSLRHAYVTNYFFRDIKSTLGHTSINMTSEYIKKGLK
jgi:hypothetical protein